eukprot:scaffold46102_cov61-Phaeocystis_antarctica.AAC.1
MYVKSSDADASWSTLGALPLWMVSTTAAAALSIQPPCCIAPNGSRKRPDGELPGAPAVNIGRDGVPPLATG